MFASNSVWHPTTEMPEENRWFVLLSDPAKYTGFTIDAVVVNVLCWGDENAWMWNRLINEGTFKPVFFAWIYHEDYLDLLFKSASANLSISNQETA